MKRKYFKKIFTGFVALAPLASVALMPPQSRVRRQTSNSTTVLSSGNYKYLRIGSDWKDEIMYQIFPIAFADSNSDGFGDLNGIKRALPYLKKLGITTIWLNPIFTSRSYHKYDTEDYYAIDPRFGTMQDFTTMVNEAHANGMKVILDVAFNHSSTYNKWFRAAIDPNHPEYNKYKHFYKIENNRNKQETKNQQTWRNISDVIRDDTRFDKTKTYRQGVFYSAFQNSSMADLNLHNPAVRTEILNVSKFWLKKGVDGFRLDATRHAYNHDEYHFNSGFVASKLNQDVWIDYADKIAKYARTSLNKNIYLLGENAFGNSYEIKQYVNGYSSLNFPNYYKMIDSLKNTNNRKRLLSSYANDLHYYKNISTINVDYWGATKINGPYALKSGNPSYIDTTFIGNHDNARIASILGHEKAALAAGLQMLSQGLPVIYYGDELGMFGNKNNGNDFDQRQPIVWGANYQLQASYINRVQANVNLTYTGTYANASVQESNRYTGQKQYLSGQFLSYYKALIAYRKAKTFMYQGQLYNYVNSNYDNVASMKYRFNNKNYLVLSNLSSFNQDVTVNDIQHNAFASQRNYQTSNFQTTGYWRQGTSTQTTPNLAIDKIFGGYSYNPGSKRITLYPKSIVVLTYA